MTFTAPRGVLGRIGAIAALATALALLAAAPASADEADDRLTIMRAAQVGAPAAAGGDVTAQQTDGGCSTDPGGDVVDDRDDDAPATHANNDRADIVEHCASYVGNLVLQVTVAEPTNPRADPAWQDATFVGWFLDTDGDDVGDYFASYNLNADGNLVTEVQRIETPTAAVICGNAPAVYDGTSYTAGPIPPECLDGETSVSVSAAVFYDAEGEGGPLLHDTAPDAGAFPDPVAQSTDCANALPAPFADRASIAAAHVNAVDCIYARGVTLGTNNAQGVRHFLPLLAIPRGQFAAFAHRALVTTDTALPDPQTPRFTDVDEGFTFDMEIHELAAADILLGVTPQEFRPHQQIRRDQTASVLVRSLAHARDAAVTPSAPGTHFSDTVGNVHADNIDAAFEEEMVQGVVAPSAGNGRLYVPAAPTSRQQMASVINRFIDNVEGS